MGAGLPELFIANGRGYLAQAFLALLRLEPLPRKSRLVEQGLRRAVQHGCPVPVTDVGGQACQPEYGVGHCSLVTDPAADPEDVPEFCSCALQVLLGP